MKIEIKRDEWLRGEGSQASRLLRSGDNKKCCLGFRCAALGVKRKRLANVGEPYEIRRFLPKDDWMLARQFNSVEAAKLIGINDDPKTTDKYKERRIKKVFAEHGDEAVFVS